MIMFKKTHQKVKLPKKILDKKILLNGFFENQRSDNHFKSN